MKKVESTRLLSYGNAKPYRPMSADAMRGVRPPAMLIEDFMAAGFVCGLTSYPGVGKTWLALAVALAVCTGEKLMGQFKVLDPGGVLFVGSDSSEADYGRQWRRLTQMLHEAWLETWEPGVDEKPVSPFEKAHFLIQSPFMLDNSDEVRRIILTALDESLFPPTTTEMISWEEHGAEMTKVTTLAKEQRGGCRLIVMDTLSRLTTANQNDNTAMEQVFANIRVICECTGAAVLLLHHNSKATEFNDGADWRGAMSQIGALDSWIQLASSKKDRSKIRAEFKKFRGITPPSFEYKQNVMDPNKANLAWLGTCDGYFGNESIKDDLLVQFTVWKTLKQAEEALWQSYSDMFPERGKFTKACQNRLKDLMDAGKLDRRLGTKSGAKGARAPFEYQIKQTTPPQETPTPESSPTATS